MTHGKCETCVHLDRNPSQKSVRVCHLEIVPGIKMGRVPFEVRDIPFGCSGHSLFRKETKR